eukprot:TRINITY_DN9453_c0_g1_i1.p1 TRINITY_DN9453_c0_g1~~TRINITY_DN9453_c0_g1_i1.p1  ORF type:complete len:454 (-),score=87.03 TRINITY_DN9453_c0_g1_i1:679-1995(-)
MSLSCFSWCHGSDATKRRRVSAVRAPPVQQQPCQLLFPETKAVGSYSAAQPASGRGQWQVKAIAIGCLVPCAVVLHDLLLTEADETADLGDFMTWKFLVSGLVLVSSCIASSRRKGACDWQDPEAGSPFNKKDVVFVAGCSVCIPADVNMEKRHVLQRFRDSFDHQKFPEDGVRGSMSSRQVAATMEFAKAFKARLWMDRHSRSEPEIYPEDRQKVASFRCRLGAACASPECSATAASSSSSASAVEAEATVAAAARAKVEGMLSSDLSLIRYLRARQHNEEAAAEVYGRTKLWREKAMPHKMHCPSCCANDPAGHDMKIVGIDAHAHPIIYGSIARASNTEAEGKVIHAICTIEKALAVSALLSEAGATKENHKFCVIVNLAHFSWRDAMDTKTGLLMAKLLGREADCASSHDGEGGVREERRSRTRNFSTRSYPGR